MVARPAKYNNLKFKYNAQSKNKLRREKKIYAYRNRKNQEKTCLQESHPHQEDEKAETETYPLLHPRQSEYQ
jgi:hypothetical protein